MVLDHPTIKQQQKHLRAKSRNERINRWRVGMIKAQHNVNAPAYINQDES